MVLLLKHSADVVEKYPYSRADLLADHPNVSFPASLSGADLTDFGVEPVARTSPPGHNPLTHWVEELTPVRIEGTWTQQWQIVALSQAEADANLAKARARVAQQVRDIRDRKMLAGGYQHNGKWFHSDLASRIQQLGLNMVGQGIPPSTRWKTMDGTFVTMTPNVAQGIFAAAMQQDLALFERGEQLIAAINASSAPESIDITTGWPATFGGV